MAALIDSGRAGLLAVGTLEGLLGVGLLASNHRFDVF